MVRRIVGRDSPTYALVTGGGTSGHVVPALAIIEALEDHGHASDTLAFVGCRRGVDRRLLAESGAVEAGVRCEYLPITGLQRGWRPSAIVRNLTLAPRLLWSRFRAGRILASWRPQVIVSVGGYASVPVALAARAAGVPLVCVSYDRRPGLATRLQARRAAACAVAFEDTHLPRSMHTGTPLRRSVRRLAEADPSRRRREARESLGLPIEGDVVLVVGGSLGSAVLNDAASRLVEALGARATSGKPVTVYHVCGDRYLETAVPVAGSVHYVRKGYEPQMTEAYLASDVLVCRAGASTVGEIAALGLAAIVVPWSAAADDHQTLNALWLAEAGGCVVMHETELETVCHEVIDLLDHDDTRADLARAARLLGERSRGPAMVDLIEAVASGRLSGS